jgi:hypothetical protein
MSSQNCLWTLAVILLISGCVSHPPSVAHVHIGHAITAVHVTPNHEGYLVTAERRGKQTFDFATRASSDSDLASIKADVALAVKATNSDDDFGLKQAIVMAANHVSFAATSDDASLNVQRSAPVFARDISGVVERCDLIILLGNDVNASKSVKEATVSVTEIVKLANANINGDPQLGTAPNANGLVQLRKELEAMISRENPRYETVPEWYLFNLVRLPNGRWVFDKFGRGGNIEGYK